MAAVYVMEIYDWEPGGDPKRISREHIIANSDTEAVKEAMALYLGPRSRLAAPSLIVMDVGRKQDRIFREAVLELEKPAAPNARRMGHKRNRCLCRSLKRALANRY